MANHMVYDANEKKWVTMSWDDVSEEDIERERKRMEEEMYHRPASDLERVEAQALYTALMTDTLIEEV